ncbi:MAG: DnaA regulatory inactivator Hda [Gammaproteobacteria bacterium]|nr:DnaA regulatory inactivator Hda [Gammaproteobacteria bacterium]
MPTDFTAQLPLDVGLRDTTSFDSFCSGRNQELVDRLKATVLAADDKKGNQIYLWGQVDCGKTHLLQALCRLASQQGCSAVYLSLADAQQHGVQWLEDVDRLGLVCIDDVQAIAGQRTWETALFTLGDRVREQAGSWVVAGIAPPKGLSLVMPELESRLARGLIYRVLGLNDDERCQAVRIRAQQRGLELSNEVMRYVLNRYPRDIAALFELLDRLDKASLASGRRLTIPFLRQLEASCGEGGVE